MGTARRSDCFGLVAGSVCWESMILTRERLGSRMDVAMRVCTWLESGKLVELMGFVKYEDKKIKREVMEHCSIHYVFFREC